MVLGYWSHKIVKAAKMFALMIILLSTGCSVIPALSPEAKQETVVARPKTERYAGEPGKEISTVYTARKELALSFNGMGKKETMLQLLDELDAHQIKATFFLPGMRVAEEPDVARAILARGHEIENNTLSRLDMGKLSYEQIYKEIQLANEVIKEKTGVMPKYVRTKSGELTEEVRLAAAQLGMEGVVKYSINPQDWDMKDAAAIGKIVERFMTRGGIIQLNTDINPQIIPAIAVIAKAAEEIGYKLVPVDELVKNGGTRKPLEQIPGFDAAQLNLEDQTAAYKYIYNFETDKAEIALTFDDFGSDRTITKILDILKEYHVPATFFLRAKGVEANPNLARAIVEDGHDVANHTYSHPVITKISLEELQQEVVKAHQVITEAVQQKPTMLFRPPTGEVDEQTATAIAAAGYTDIAMYDVTTMDWDNTVSADEIIRIISSQTQPGSVILLHMQDDIHTIEALPAVIEELQGRGYAFKKLAEMIGLNP